MEKVFIVTVTIVVLYCFIKFIEMRYIEKEMKPLKLVVRDALIVGVSSILSLFFYFYLEKYLLDFYGIITNTKNAVLDTKVLAFTDEPSF